MQANDTKLRDGNARARRQCADKKHIHRHRTSDRMLNRISLFHDFIYESHVTISQQTTQRRWRRCRWRRREENCIRSKNVFVISSFIPFKCNECNKMNQQSASQTANHLAMVKKMEKKTSFAHTHNKKYSLRCRMQGTPNRTTRQPYVVSIVVSEWVCLSSFRQWTTEHETLFRTNNCVRCERRRPKSSNRVRWSQISFGDQSQKCLKNRLRTAEAHSVQYVCLHKFNGCSYLENKFHWFAVMRSI